MEKNRDAIVGYHDGAGRYGGKQNEIILEIAAITQEDIYSMGGHSSSFEQLVNEAATEIYGPNATFQQREALLLKVSHIRSEAGPNWLSTEATQRVLSRMKPHAERLGDIKQRQEKT
ncbi:hypothetical protein SAMIE_1023700 [Sphingobium amiense]|uniref:Uncharacterized protein n=2 Tax=Sphingobium amiense TaxID=135719 RepID=A0A494WEH1_9SPHN|nr:hypothetical protein SAMIE_1023700 [Sphingobium amiense]